MITKIVHWMSFISLIFAFMFMVLIFTWLLYPYKVVDMEQPFKILDKVVQQGNVIRYLIVYTKYSKVTTILHKTISGDYVYYLAPDESAQPVGRRTSIVSITLPSYIPPGIYQVNIAAIYKVNPIRIITKHWKTETFKVIEKKE